MFEIKRKVERIDILSSLIVASESRDKEPIKFDNLCKFLGKLSGILDLSDFSISPGAKYSEDIARWLSNMEESDYLVQKNSEIIFNEKGLQFCRRHFLQAIFTESKKPEIEKIIETLGINLEKVQSSFWDNFSKYYG